MHGARWIPAMLLITAFQLISFAQVIFTDEGINMTVAIVFGIFLLLEWVYSIASTLILRRSSPALEYIAFFLTGINLAITASASERALLVQFIAMMAGFVVFIALLWMIANVDRAEKFRMPMGVFAIAFLIFGLIFARNTNGAYNWVEIGGFSFQASEIVKIMFIFVGAATLEKIQNSRNIWQYVGFSVACVGLLFLMRDLGTALIFFFTFVVLAFMRSGDVRTILFVILAGGIGFFLYECGEDVYFCTTPSCTMRSSWR